MVTREEYELLKHYRATGYRWIARDGDDECLYLYKSKPIKLGVNWGTEHACYQWFVNDDSLPYVKWEDEEPTKINDLIRDYESHQVITGENNVNKSELIKEIEEILDDIGVSDYQLGEYEEDTIWAISSITIRELFSAIEKYSVEKEKQYILKFSNGQYLYSCDLGITDEALGCKLTKAEIEAVDPRLMEFAKEVE